MVNMATTASLARLTFRKGYTIRSGELSGGGSARRDDSGAKISVENAGKYQTQGGVSTPRAEATAFPNFLEIG